MPAARAIDHLVLAVTDLAHARTRMGLLGFTVAPDARHPFGTENACVFFQDGSYLEPLAIGSEDGSRETARAGNVFTARDRAFRFRQGQEGLEAVVFRTDDAAADHAAYVSAGFSAGKILEFSRPFAMPDGQVSEAAFRLAFASDLRSPDFYAFTIRRVRIDRHSPCMRTARWALRGSRYANRIQRISPISLGLLRTVILPFRQAMASACRSEPHACPL
mgnify:CR=1 FL=1